MAEVFVGQIMMTGFPFAPGSPSRFAQCNGNLMAISQNQALFALLGVMYGGNGVSTFALPDLRGRTPVGGFPSSDPSWQPSPYPQGLVAGIEQETLLQTEMPLHSHSFGANTTSATAKSATGTVFAQSVVPGGGTAENIYAPAGGNLVPLDNSTLGLSPPNPNLPHSNLQPSLVMNFNIALYGVFPSRN